MVENQMEGTARDVGGKIESAVGSVTDDTKSTVQGKVDQAAGKAQRAYGDAKDAVASAADDAGSTLGGVAKQVGEQASQLGGQAYEQGSKAAQYVGDYVRNEPIAAMLGVAALGMLVGYLLGRPPHDRALELGRFRAAYRDR